MNVMSNLKQSSSINIIRDQDKSIDYIPSANTTRIANFILDEFKRGIHSFNIIGSYGTGKSSFLWAFNKSISSSEKENFFDFPNKLFKQTDFINIVGEFNSLIDYFKVLFSIENKLKGNQEIFDCIFQKYEAINKNDGILIICIDEFGKFLEYASKHDPEKEMYFIQQFAEFVNDSNRNILFLTSVHQAIDSYSIDLTSSQKNEWRKVKGRFNEISFNEPVEQLLFLASQYFKSKYSDKISDEKYLDSLITLNKAHHCFSIGEEYIEKIGNNLYPLDIFSAIVLTKSLQKYGQNERSLFTFLQTSDHLGLDSLKENQLFDLPKLYDYLLVNLYSILVSKHNPDYSQWALIRDAIERAESKIDMDLNIALDLLKSIGLINLFSSKGASINEKLLVDYLSFKFSSKLIIESIKKLVIYKIIRFNEFNNSYKLFGGSDMDIEDAIIKIGNSIDTSIDIVPRLKEAFDFPIITAKETLYRTGTPRLFEFKISENPIFDIPANEVDGFINLIFNENIRDKDIEEQTSGKDSAILYGVYKNTSTIRKTLIEIVKTEKVLGEVEIDDKFAKEELNNIINSQKALLNYYVLDSLYSNKIQWFFDGKKIKLNSKQKLNNFLSEICSRIYPLTPIINMELINKHKVSGAINSSRKSYFNRLVNHWTEKDLGYPNDKFPSDKTIYWSLIKNKGIHNLQDGNYVLSAPNADDQNFLRVWEACELFLESAKTETKNITELIDILSKRPFKLKLGVIDFLIPTFLFAKKGDFALYDNSGGYIPYLNETVLYLMNRNPKQYSLKSFELSNLRLNMFNKYRSYLNQEKKKTFSNESFIESIRPFLVLYKGLTPYSQKTKKLSKESLNLRESISKAEDPEKIFFEKFPKALDYEIKDLIASEQLFDEYILKFQKTVLEIKNSFDELLNRIEKYLTQEVLGVKSEFPAYKTILQKRFSTLKEHQFLQSQKTFMLRVNSDLDDRDSWLVSICFALLGKSLNSITDKEETILKDKLSLLVQELDNFCEINNVIFDQEKEEVYKIDFTSQKNGLQKHLVRISKNQNAKIEKSVLDIKNKLSDDKQLRIAILTKLLRKELDSE
tara:strand:- start:9059 stop:12301 length:3243 start_codon:yes stop_codon:yes gene_type:complete